MNGEAVKIIMGACNSFRINTEHILSQHIPGRTKTKSCDWYLASRKANS